MFYRTLIFLLLLIFQVIILWPKALHSQSAGASSEEQELAAANRDLSGYLENAKLVSIYFCEKKSWPHSVEQLVDFGKQNKLNNTFNKYLSATIKESKDAGLELSLSKDINGTKFNNQFIFKRPTCKSKNSTNEYRVFRPKEGNLSLRYDPKIWEIKLTPVNDGIVLQHKVRCLYVNFSVLTREVSTDRMLISLLNTKRKRDPAIDFGPSKLIEVNGRKFDCRESSEKFNKEVMASKDCALSTEQGSAYILFSGPADCFDKQAKEITEILEGVSLSSNH